ncbi:MAG: acyltransferase [Acetatifactor sp.]|nr:acyltransferase [Acetatifactor sp.]
MNVPKRVRNANIEWMRIIAMYMVVMLHALGKGGLLTNLIGAKTIVPYISWLLEALCIVAVNVYILISGYVLCFSKFKIQRLIEIIAQVLFYSIGCFVVLVGANAVNSSWTDTYTLLRSVLPIHMDMYWFVTDYVIVYMLFPFLQKSIQSISRRKFEVLLAIMLLFNCVIKSLAPALLTVDGLGYNIAWFLNVFLVGAYIKRFGLSRSVKPFVFFCIYLLGCLMTFAERFALEYVYVKTGRLHDLMNVSYDYNHIFPFIASVALFLFVISLKEKNNLVSKIGLALSPMSFGVYLLHEHMLVRYAWVEWLHVTGLADKNPVVFTFAILSCAGIVLIIGIAADYGRILIFRILANLGRLLHIDLQMERINGVINE